MSNPCSESYGYTIIELELDKKTARLKIINKSEDSQGSVYSISSGRDGAKTTTDAIDLTHLVPQVAHPLEKEGLLLTVENKGEHLYRLKLENGTDKELSIQVDGVKKKCPPHYWVRCFVPRPQGTRVELLLEEDSEWHPIPLRPGVSGKTKPGPISQEKSRQPSSPSQARPASEDKKENLQVFQEEIDRFLQLRNEGVLTQLAQAKSQIKTVTESHSQIEKWLSSAQTLIEKERGMVSVAQTLLGQMEEKRNEVERVVARSLEQSAAIGDKRAELEQMVDDFQKLVDNLRKEEEGIRQKFEQVNSDA